MRSKLVKATAISLFALIISGCASSDSDEVQLSKQSATALYKQARTSMELGNFTKAVQTLSALDSRYPFGAHKTQVQLDLIYSYYKLDDSANALANIDRFLRLNPTHPDTDYVQFMRGLVNMQQDSYLFHDMFNIDRTDRDPTYAREAFADFEKLLISYPNSRYVKDARQRMLELRNRLARYSIQVAEYYMKMDAFSAAVNRAQLVVETYPGSDSTKRALEIMIEGYGELGQQTLQQHAQEVYSLNFESGE
ncbi:outer membrane protein assembly factor BamD [Paraferrimonas sedimenticola]|uniref:Outer membrane protein assembly factor BamD n=1 Tax=Paraferrimonas sedimenticola TaxID=375674 RepID=A0AA37VZD4_9GAMM|nr:outer membrane protein assembly factor BamD [Paraferrimonas sedimenticola]GLP97134.1 outer membrane protein assembly factor BamD [Paraferrimonas sedimenticola]